jgi:hypothetical protein
MLFIKRNSSTIKEEINRLRKVHVNIIGRELRWHSLNGNSSTIKKELDRLGNAPIILFSKRCDGIDWMGVLP